MYTHYVFYTVKKPVVGHQNLELRVKDIEKLRTRRQEGVEK